MPRPRRSNLSRQSRNARRIRNIANERTEEEQEIDRKERRVSMARLRAVYHKNDDGTTDDEELITVLEVLKENKNFEKKRNARIVLYVEKAVLNYTEQHSRLSRKAYESVAADRLPKPCSKSDPDYNDCSLKFLRKFQSQLLNGVRELNIPSFNPYHLPVYVINRTINDAASVSAVITDARIWGFDTMEIKKCFLLFRFDHDSLSGEGQVYFPKARVSFEYDVTATLFGPTPLTDSGYCKGDLSDFTVNAEFSYKPFEKLGVKYFTLDKAKVSAELGGAHVKLTSKKAENQGIADFVSNFINEDPKRTFNTVYPILKESGESMARLMVEQILSVIPADELIPE
ncbi:hypothetical protein ILUMI_25808 [Ignelater luminosus]|uniref:Uncharacterized protein n=1 Tax=Ignelater luminosus TaxID=2038154 RepID=A0A8K0C7R0_IGNLU|nr:hypothetical protein ILUMI_25808 [Ignelater luminosus]